MADTTRATVSLRKPLTVAAVVTLAVTLVRLGGELAQGSSALFNRQPGGPFALVGIVWLIPVFGVLFGLRLAAGGDGPPSVWGALGWAGLAFAVNIGLFVVAIRTWPRSPLAQLAIFGVGSWIAIAIAWRGWPALWRALLAYGLLARVPVVVIMFFAIFLGWDSHYAKPRPDFPPMGHLGLFLWTAVLPQATLWIYLTVVGGILFGAAAVGVRRLVRSREAASLTSAA
jgi:hypothetical protein